MATITPMSEMLGQYLDLANAQLKLTVSNMANVDTPGYKTQGFDFEQELRRQQAGFDLAGPQASAIDGLVARPDGNNVSMDREGVQLAETQLKFKMAAQLLKHEYAGILSAIHSEMK